MNKELPIYELIIEDDNGLDIVSLVDSPAIGKNYFAFKENKKYTFDIDNERMILSGPSMIPDMLIYRNDNKGEYYTYFSKSTIENCVMDYMANSKNTKTNLMHTTFMADNTFVFESFIKDSSRGINGMKGFEDCPDGTWFISVKVNDAKVWEKIKNGELNGFSIEGFFTPVESTNNEYESLLNEVNELHSLIVKKQK